MMDDARRQRQPPNVAFARTAMTYPSAIRNASVPKAPMAGPPFSPIPRREPAHHAHEEADEQEEEAEQVPHWSRAPFVDDYDGNDISHIL